MGKMLYQKKVPEQSFRSVFVFPWQSIQQAVLGIF